MSSDLNPSEKNESETPRSADSDVPPDDRFGRLHVTSLFFGILAHFRAVVFPATVAIFSAANGSTWGLSFAVILIVPATVGLLVRYFSFRYRILDRELVVTSGILFRRTRIVPVHRIQNVNLVQNLLHRAVNVAEVRVETASGKEPEAVLRVIPMTHVEALRDAIFQSKDSTPVEEADDPVRQPEQTKVSETELLRIPTPWLCKAGLANDGGMVIVGVLIGAWFQFDLDERFNLGPLFDVVKEHATGGMGGLWIFVAVVAAFVLVRIFTMVWYILRFHNYTLTRVGDDLQIACGLFTKVSASVPRKRIQFISIQHNLWMRWMGLSSIRIETAGGSGNKPNDASGSVSGRWFLPVLPLEHVPQIVHELRDGLEWAPETLEWQPVSQRAGRRLMRIPILIAIIVGAIGLANLQPWGFLSGVMVGAPLIYLAFRASRAMRYARTEDGVIYRSGIITKKTSMTFFDRIQGVRLDRSPFDRRWKMAKLSVDTAAAGPAGHRIHIPHLSDDFAESEYWEILQRASA
jgi:putative membrane protein